MIRRIYVEKKVGFDVEAQGLLLDFRQNLHLDGLARVRVLNRYDIEDIDDATYEKAKYIVFAEPAVDLAFDEKMPADLCSAFFISEYLPGQYDQRADSAEQCLRMLDSECLATVRSAKVIALIGDISAEDLERAKAYYINPVESRVAEIEKPLTLKDEEIEGADVVQVNGFISMDDEALMDYRKEMGLAMSSEDIKCVRAYFRDIEKRDPFVTEIKVIDTYWSDHCRHTTFQTELTGFDFEESDYGRKVGMAFDEYMTMRSMLYGEREVERPITLMDIACIGTKYLKLKGKCADLDISEEINACSFNTKAIVKKDGLEKEEDWLCMFKNETHNHPTEIEPFGGAATCLGGAIRDPLSGRAYVYQAMRVTGSADPRESFENTLEGKLPQRKITQGAAAGYSSYGNQIGIATGLVDEIYHKGYKAKRMEVGAVIAAAPKENVRRERPVSGDAIILVGGRTGRDGCGGATGSSKEHTEESIFLCGAEVQKGNPPIERGLQRLFRRKDVAKMIKRCNDFGAGGVSVAIGELADSIKVDLDLVPKKYAGLDGTELAISESQERMAVVVDRENVEKFIESARNENLEATHVADVTDTGRFQMLCKGKLILDLSREFLNTNGARQYANVHVVKMSDDKKASQGEKDTLLDEKQVSLDEKAKAVLKDLNSCSKKGLVQRFDSTIGAGTVLMPLGGKYQLSPSMGMSALLPMENGETQTATLMSYGFDPALSEKDPYHGAMYAVVDSATKIAAMGGDIQKIRLSFQEYFEKLSSDESWGKPLSALLGALKAQKELEIPAIGGKDSMSGTFKDINVPPTLISFAVAVENAKNITSTEFKNIDSVLVYLSPRIDGEFDFEKYKTNMSAVYALTSMGLLRSACTVGKGGLFSTLVKMAVGNKIGACVEWTKPFTEDYGALVIEIPSGEGGVLEQTTLAALAMAEYTVIGKTTKDQRIVINASADSCIDLSLEEITEIWQEPLEEIFPVLTEKEKGEEFDLKADDLEIAFYEGKKDLKCETSQANSTHAISCSSLDNFARPRVIIPVFPGTNCEIDSKRAFEKAGADVKIQIINNLSKEALERSAKELAQNIKNSQIVMLPGGFSGGDEPDGSAKYIVSLFRNQYISEAVEDLMNNRDGLMLGICNGFQALIKLGLLPYGKICDMDDDSSTLTYNTIGRHQSGLINTRIISTKSPWLRGVNTGDVHTIPISHGEGRFIASDQIIKELSQNGQIATQYCDYDGVPSMSTLINPNGSRMAIEGITSPDGRIFGKMGHSERIGEFLYKNVPGNKDQRIFKSGVSYFK